MSWCDVIGTDCQDCGMVGSSNFTRSDPDGWFEDDDDKNNFDDAEFVGAIAHETCV
jgi:hypothetical protein